MAESARVVSVHIEQVGSGVLDDHAPGETTLRLDSVDDLPETGQVAVDGITYTYTASDPEADTLTLSAGLAGAVTADTFAAVEPAAYVKKVNVVLDADEAQDAIEVSTPVGLYDRLPVGIREPGQEEAAEVDLDRGVLLDLPGVEPVVDGEYLDPETVPGGGGGGTDGDAPASSPAATLTEGIGIVRASWSAILNADPVTYEIHAVLASTLADPEVPDFTTDATTLVDQTIGTGYTIRALPDGSLPAYGEDIAVRIVATDADGAAPAGDGAIAAPRQTTGDDISVEYAYAGTILVDQLVGGSLTSDILISAAMKTATAGQRLEINSGGLRIYNGLGVARTVLAPDQSVFRGDVEADNLIVNLGAELRGAIEVARGTTMTFGSGITRPTSPPTTRVDHEYLLLGLDYGQHLGFNETPQGLEWSSIEGRWHVQTRHNDGTGHIQARVHFHNATTGAWEGSVTDPGEGGNGSRRMTLLGAAHEDKLVIRSGTGSTAGSYRVQFNGVSIGLITRFQIERNPVLQRAGDDTFRIVERGDSARAGSLGGKLVVRTFQVTGGGTSLSLVSSLGYGSGWNNDLRIVGFYSGIADYGVNRVTFLFSDPNGPYREYRSFSAATGNPADAFPLPKAIDVADGGAWDGSHFWTLDEDIEGVKIYRHEGGAHAGASSSTNLTETWWAGYTWRDTDPGGVGTQETDIGPLRSFEMSKRARVTVTASAPNDGGDVDDPDAVGVYLGIGATSPARTSLWFQGESTAELTVTDAATSGTNPPATNGFTTSAPAWARSAALDINGRRVWELSGTGGGKAGPLEWDKDGNLVPDGWHVIGSAGEPAWGTGGLSANKETKFLKDAAGTVHLMGQVAGATHADVLFTLPVGYRPSDLVSLSLRTNDADDPHILWCDTDGVVKTFSSTGSSWVSVTCSFTTL